MITITDNNRNRTRAYMDQTMARFGPSGLDAALGYERAMMASAGRIMAEAASLNKTWSPSRSRRAHASKPAIRAAHASTTPAGPVYVSEAERLDALKALVRESISAAESSRQKLYNKVFPSRPAAPSALTTSERKLWNKAYGNQREATLTSTEAQQWSNLFGKDHQ
ncbi:hypothetical protein [Tessaracoccus lacteus]|uniref:Uncharacterized protein n=1 Tax=Tessaracoccus lacteus TaxID=3041766 RepID=A0ABY8PXN4_9ACTN|nr:hypothetical protein [Tessaracoccus sp. T21]WGT47224.1 hypothetical protein QH948_00050 [Tessaracoccus sp. T21]